PSTQLGARSPAKGMGGHDACTRILSFQRHSAAWDCQRESEQTRQSAICAGWSLIHGRGSLDLSRGELTNTMDSIACQAASRTSWSNCHVHLLQPLLEKLVRRQEQECLG